MLYHTLTSAASQFGRLRCPRAGRLPGKNNADLADKCRPKGVGVIFAQTTDRSSRRDKQTGGHAEAQLWRRDVGKRRAAKRLFGVPLRLLLAEIQHGSPRFPQYRMCLGSPCLGQSAYAERTRIKAKERKRTLFFWRSGGKEVAEAYRLGDLFLYRLFLTPLFHSPQRGEKDDFAVTEYFQFGHFESKRFRMIFYKFTRPPKLDFGTSANLIRFGYAEIIAEFRQSRNGRGRGAPSPHPDTMALWRGEANSQ